eukprot:TRINITY_DN30166_c0_g2_i2.p1 TRINITY_DN30166_c0_g2~~TRINITY_DN30166_c0_g2_i2.p1  ORF type:complete len:526 (+),score=106.71 TRINITY_DN30166_c0_g2_i2:151-1728(+)
MGSTSGEGAEADGAAAEGSEGEVRPKRSLPRRKSTAEGAALERPSSPKGGTRRRSSVRSIKPGCREGFLESKEVSQTADVSFALGDRVCYVGYADAAGPQFGVVRFVGETHFAGGTWVGIELESPCGKNDGQVKGVRYFECAAERGLFARPAHLRHADASDDRMRSQSLPGTAASVAADSGNDECASADVASAEDAAATAAAAAADPRAPGLEALPEDEVAVDDGRAAHSEPPLARIDDDKESGAEASQSRFKWTMSPLERRMLAIESLLELLEPAMRRLDALEGQVANLEEAARGSTRSATVSLEHLEKELKVATARTTGMEGRLAELENVFAALPERTGGDAAAGGNHVRRQAAGVGTRARPAPPRRAGEDGRKGADDWPGGTLPAPRGHRWWKQLLGGAACCRRDGGGPPPRGPRRRPSCQRLRGAREESPNAGLPAGSLLGPAQPLRRHLPRSPGLGRVCRRRRPGDLPCGGRGQGFHVADCLGGLFDNVVHARSYLFAVRHDVCCTREKPKRNVGSCVVS